MHEIKVLFWNIPDYSRIPFIYFGTNNLYNRNSGPNKWIQSGKIHRALIKI